ncbi:hypothetical protein [Kribbella sp. NPDC051718]|uniref:hypothetical protein n=1 Tax=Kribbella sp. NPDC051718 TaxID=3155168 RepID=UPI0034398736
MRGTLIALGVFCWLATARLIVAAVNSSPGYWVLAIAAAYGGFALIQRSMRPEYRHVPPPQSTRDWDTYLAPKPAKPATPKPVSAQVRVDEVEPPVFPVTAAAAPLLATSPQFTPSTERQKGPVVRDDITAAVEAAPANVQAKLGSSGRDALKLLDEHLPQHERVHHIISAGVEPLRTVENCALVVTDLRLLFINPLPQVVAWDLTQIANVHASLGFQVTTRGGDKTHLGISGDGNHTFVSHLQVAMAIATLRATA